MKMKNRWLEFEEKLMYWILIMFWGMRKWPTFYWNRYKHNPEMSWNEWRNIYGGS